MIQIEGQRLSAADKWVHVMHAKSKCRKNYFPIDMLRYDRACLSGQSSVDMIEKIFREGADPGDTVNLFRYAETSRSGKWTLARWPSGWEPNSSNK